VVAALPDRIDVPRRNTHEFKVLRSKKLVPQPQDAVAFGLTTRKDAPMRSSTKIDL